MKQKGWAPIRYGSWECTVCGRRFGNEKEAWAEFKPPDPFPEGTRVRVKASGREGTVIRSEVLTDMDHGEHWRVISVDYGLGVEHRYIHQDDDQSKRLEAA